MATENKEFSPTGFVLDLHHKVRNGTATEAEWTAYRSAAVQRFLADFDRYLQEMEVQIRMRERMPRRWQSGPRARSSHRQQAARRNSSRSNSPGDDGGPGEPPGDAPPPAQPQRRGDEHHDSGENGGDR
jgi:hypothetical protein